MAWRCEWRCASVARDLLGRLHDREPVACVDVLAALAVALGQREELARQGQLEALAHLCRGIWGVRCGVWGVTQGELEALAHVPRFGEAEVHPVLDHVPGVAGGAGGELWGAVGPCA